MFFKKTAAFLFLSCVSTTTFAGSDVTIGDLSARIDDLEKKAGGQAPDGSELAGREEIESLRTQIKELRGRIEELEHGASSGMQKKPGMEMIKDEPAASHSSAREHHDSHGGSASDDKGGDDDDDIDAIMTSLAKGSAKAKVSPKDIERDQATAKADKEAPTSTLDSDSGTAQYNQALALFNKSEFAEAEEAFRFYISQNKDGKFVSQAKVKIAQCQLGNSRESGNKGKAKESAKEFAALYKANSKGTAGAEALFGMAEAMAAQGETKKACVVLKKLKNDFPKEKDIQGRATALAKQAKCA